MYWLTPRPFPYRPPTVYSQPHGLLLPTPYRPVTTQLLLFLIGLTGEPGIIVTIIDGPVCPILIEPRALTITAYLIVTGPITGRWNPTTTRDLLCIVDPIGGRLLLITWLGPPLLITRWTCRTHWPQWRWQADGTRWLGLIFPTGWLTPDPVVIVDIPCYCWWRYSHPSDIPALLLLWRKETDFPGIATASLPPFPIVAWCLTYAPLLTFRSHYSHCYWPGLTGYSSGSGDLIVHWPTITIVDFFYRFPVIVIVDVCLITPTLFRRYRQLMPVDHRTVDPIVTVTVIYFETLAHFIHCSQLVIMIDDCYWLLLIVGFRLHCWFITLLLLFDTGPKLIIVVVVIGYHLLPIMTVPSCNARTGGWW